MKKTLKKIIKPVYLIIKDTLFDPIYFYNYYKKSKLSATQKRFINNLSCFKTISKGKEEGILLVQMVENYEYTMKFAAAGKILSEKKNLYIQLYEVEIDWLRGAKKPVSIYDSFFKSPQDKIHLVLGNKIALRNSDKYHDQKLIKSKLKTIIDDLNKKGISNLVTLQLEGITVGDLIYDTYLRFFHKTTITEINTEVSRTIEVALNLFYNFNSFIKNNNVKCLLNSYCSYIHHGIPARICLHNNIDVYAVASHIYAIQKINKDYPFHHLNHTLFSPDRKLTQEQLDFAKQSLTSRFEGKIDAATSYMRNSVYKTNPLSSELKQKFSEKSRNIIIYAHDFYDSPHVNRMLQFPDLFQFLKQTLDALTDLQDTNVFIKTHPNGLDGCKEITIDLVRGYNKNHFQILDESVSNLNIIELKPDLICTARGTVGIEMSYFELPVVALYDNPYVNFNFVHNCTNKEDYFSILKGEKKPEIDFNKEKIYSFYYQAYLEKSLDDGNNIFSVLHSYTENTFCDTYLEFIMNSHTKEIFSDKFLDYYRI